MGLILGIDTGGTYTDSALVRVSDRAVIKTAKSLTTRENLLHGIASSIDCLSWEHMEEVSIVCLSTTLATNAVVEGRGGRTGLLYMGRRLREEELPADIVFAISGQLDIKGREREHIEPFEIIEKLKEMRGKVDAVAISGFASVRNPQHELQVKKLVQENLQVPVVCAHEISSSLGFLDRTTTAILNAALIPNITQLIHAVRQALKAKKIDAPCMVVRGDGSLILDEMALDRPIETVLSGPAASVVGGVFLTNEKDALLVDMGGTTTDIAHVVNGRVRIQKSGAMIGGWKTQLRAAEISTHGIGGDSWIQMNRHGSLTVGPQRVTPLYIAGMKNPSLREEWVKYRLPREHEIVSGQVIDTYELLTVPEQPTYEEKKLTDLLADGPHTRFYLTDRMGCDYDKMDFAQYVQQGILQRCSFTPTDVLIAMGKLRLETETVRAAADMMAYRTAEHTDAFLERCLAAVQQKLRIACLQSTADFAGSSFDFYAPTVKFLLKKEQDILCPSLTLKKPIIAIGAPVSAWFPEVCQQLGTELIIPQYAEVANAIGAAVGQVIITTEALIRPDQYHKGFLVHTNWENQWFKTLEQAEAWSKQSAQQQARKKAEQAGCGVCTVSCLAEPTYAEDFGREEHTFIQTQIVVTAIGSPLWAEQ